MFFLTENIWHKVMCLFFLGAMTPLTKAQNIIVNGGFENNPPSNNGNNIGWQVNPWKLGPGNRSNVVQVDGPNGFDYANRGPESDASNNGQGAGPGVAQHYLDITDGSNDFYQSFKVPTCGAPQGQSRTVVFSGWFSTRGNRSGSGALTIRQGDGLSGDVVARVGVNLPVPQNGSKFEPWKKVEGKATIQSGEQISMVVSMDDNVNFDEGYLSFADGQCVTSQLTLAKEWEQPVNGDRSTVMVSRDGNQIDSFVSTAPNNSQDDTPVTVFEEETLDLAESMNNANQGQYQASVQCSGAGRLNDSQLTVDQSGGPIVCTYKNVIKRAELSIDKSNQVDQVTRGKPFNYLIHVKNAGPARADEAVIKDPPVDGLSCTSVRCEVTSGKAQCPDPLSVSALQSGLAIPQLPKDSGLQLTLQCTAK